MKHGHVLRRICLAATVALVVVMTQGCATIVCTPNQTVSIKSKPDLALVRIQRPADNKLADVWEGKTPAKVKLPRKGAYLVTVEKQGYTPQETVIGQDSWGNVWVLGNLPLLAVGLIPGIIGITVDGSTGAAMKLSPDVIDVTLLPVGVTAGKTSPAPAGP